MTTTFRRPFGITLIAILYLLETMVALGLAAYLLLSPTSFSIYSTLFERLQLSAALAGLLAVPPLLAAGLAAMVFRGLWMGRDWARLAAMVIAFMVLLAIVAAAAFLLAFEFASTRSLTIALVLALLCMVAFIYLARVRLADTRTVAQPHPVVPVVALAPFPVLESEPYTVQPPVATAVSPPAVAPPEPLRPASAPASYQPVAGSLVPPPQRPARQVTTTPPLGQPQSAAGGPSTADALPDAGAVAASAHDSAADPAEAPVDVLPPDAGEEPAELESLAAIAPAMPTLLIPGAAPQAQPAFWLVVRNGAQQGQVFPLSTAQEVVIGRDPNRSDICLQDPTVSARHATLRYENGRCVLYDLSSTNGTYLGGLPVERQPLQNGDELQLGGTMVLFLTQQP